MLYSNWNDLNRSIRNLLECTPGSTRSLGWRVAVGSSERTVNVVS